MTRKIPPSGPPRRRSSLVRAAEAEGQVDLTIGPPTQPGPEATKRRRAHHPWFTALTLLALLISAWATGTLTVPLPRGLLNNLGVAARDIFEGDWQRLVVSALVTHGDWVLVRALLWVTFAVGAMELRFGTAAAALTFWSAHAISVAALAVGVVAASDGGSAAERLAMARDVGPSAGYLACFACVLWSLSGLKRKIGLSIVVAALMILPFAPPLAPVGPLIDLTADLSHLLAFAFGSAVAWWLLRRRRGALPLRTHNA